MKLTTQQRSKIYRQAAEKMDADDWRRGWRRGCCYYLEKLGFGMSVYDDLLLPKEFNLFNPKNGELFWWHLSEIQPRILALLFCSLLALEEK